MPHIFLQILHYRIVPCYPAHCLGRLTMWEVLYFTAELFCHPDSYLPRGRVAFCGKYVSGWVLDLARKMTLQTFRSWSVNVVKRCICYCKVCLSVRSVALVSNASSVQDIEICLSEISETVKWLIRSNPSCRTAPKVGNGQFALTPPHLCSQSHLIDSPRFKNGQRIVNIPWTLQSAHIPPNLV